MFSGCTGDFIRSSNDRNLLTICLTTAQPLEWTVPHRDGPCYAKLICLKTEKERVIGFHVTGPNAGEMTQGYGVAMRYGAPFKRKSRVLVSCFVRQRLLWLRRTRA